LTSGAESGILDNMDIDWPEITGSHSALEDLKDTNPHYKEKQAYQKNCQRCVPAYEMRRRGYDVTATPGVLAENGRISENDVLAINDNWRNVFNGAYWERVIGSGKEDIIQKMETWGDGARAEIYVELPPSGVDDDGVAHVFAAIRENGITQFVDPQDGTDGVEWIFNYVMTDKTEMARIDNLAPTNLIKYCCERRKRK